MKSVEGKIVLITGAAMGMGRLYAQRAALEGAKAVVLWDIDADALAATTAELATPGVRVVPYLVDISSLASISDAAGRVRAEVGHPEVLVNNAGIVRSGYFWDHHSERDTELTMRVNAIAPMQIAAEFLPGMIEGAGPHRILNVASAAGTVSNPKMSVYAASKWAVIGWSDSLRLELVRAGHAHVGVTTLAPSYISTGMFDGARGPLLTPIMAPDYVVDRAWAAMLAARPFLMLPWTVSLGRALNGLLPQRAFDFVAGRLFGVYRSMDDFTGRVTQKSPKES